MKNYQHKLRFLIKMRVRTTLYEKQFRRYENSPQNVKIHQLFMKMMSPLPVIWKNINISKSACNKGLIRSKSSEKFSLLNICTMIHFWGHYPTH